MLISYSCPTKNFFAGRQNFHLTSKIFSYKWIPYSWGGFRSIYISRISRVHSQIIYIILEISIKGEGIVSNQGSCLSSSCCCTALWWWNCWSTARRTQCSPIPMDYCLAAYTYNCSLQSWETKVWQWSSSQQASNATKRASISFRQSIGQSGSRVHQTPERIWGCHQFSYSIGSCRAKNYDNNLLSSIMVDIFHLLKLG